MARSYGQIYANIWRDGDFRKLDVEAQWAYMMLVSQSDISSCGLLSITLGRWSQYADDLHRDDLSESLSVLAEHRFVAVDFDTEELLVRSFAKWDEGYRNDNRRKALVKAAGAVASARLKTVLAGELDRLGVAHGMNIEGPIRERRTDSEDPYQGSSDAPAEPVRTPPVLVKLGEYLEPEPDPQPDPDPETEDPKTSVSRKRATRLPDDWTPDEHLVAWQREQGIPDLVARRQLEKFRDYWGAIGGQRGTKLDWPATWRNWLRNSADWQAQSKPSNRPSTPWNGA